MHKPLGVDIGFEFDLHRTSSTLNVEMVVFRKFRLPLALNNKPRMPKSRKASFLHVIVKEKGTQSEIHTNVQTSFKMYFT